LVIATACARVPDLSAVTAFASVKMTSGSIGYRFAVRRLASVDRGTGERAAHTHAGAGPPPVRATIGKRLGTHGRRVASSAAAL
jgi:hypothetical protein